MKRAARGSIWRVIVCVTLLLLAIAVSAVYYNPFFLVDRGVRAYLQLHHVQSNYVDVGGNRIHYAEAAAAGDGPERPVVLVHGLGARAWDWAPLIPALAAQGYHVYALDLLGYGDSSKPANGDFSLRGEETVVLDFMRTLHIERADLGGWSMGGWIGVLLTLDHPEAVRRLMLFDSAGLYFDPDFDAGLFAPSDRSGMDRLVARIEPDRPFIKLPGFAVPGMIRRMQKNRWIVERSFRSMVSGREVLDFRVAQLRLPVLIVWGTEDKLTPYVQAEHMHTLIPQSVLAGFRGCGHLAAAECAGRVTPVVLNFLSAEPPLPGAVIVQEGRPAGR